jgi:hypothetical protein
MVDNRELENVADDGTSTYSVPPEDMINETTEKAWNALDVSRKAEKEIDNKEWNSRTTKKLDMLKSLNTAGKFKKDWGEEKLQGWVDQNYSWEKLSQQFKLKLDSDFKNPKIGWRSGTMAAVFLVEEENGNHRRISNQGFGHKVRKAVELKVETVPGVVLRFTTTVSEDDKLEVKQELQDCENNPDNHPGSNPVKEQDRISSLKRSNPCPNKALPDASDWTLSKAR